MKKFVLSLCMLTVILTGCKTRDADLVELKEEEIVMDTVNNEVKFETQDESEEMEAMEEYEMSQLEPAETKADGTRVYKLDGWNFSFSLAPEYKNYAPFKFDEELSAESGMIVFDEASKQTIVALGDGIEPMMHIYPIASNNLETYKEFSDMYVVDEEVKIGDNNYKKLSQKSFGSLVITSYYMESEEEYTFNFQTPKDLENVMESVLASLKLSGL
ncbi:MAG: hypothetical protein AAB373_06370 [Patescibacteria group bacterium]